MNDTPAISHETADQLEELVLRWAWLLDHDRNQEIHGLFTKDGTYTIDGVVVRGKAQFEARYRKRTSGGVTSRHATSNLRLHAEIDGTILGAGILTVYRHADAAPNFSPPMGILDFEDRYVFDEGHGWRFAARKLTPIIRCMAPRT